MAATRAATMELAPIDPDDQGRHDYAGPLVADLVFADWSASALRRITDEVCRGSSAGPLLPGGHGGPDGDVGGSRRVRPPPNFTGVAGVAAERFRHVLGLPPTLEGAATLLGLHPGLLPYEYVRCDVEFHERLIVRIGRDTGAMADGAWPSMLDADHLGPLDAIVRALDDHLGCEPVSDDGSGLVVEVVRGAEPVPASGDVLLTRFSTGAAFVFEDRGTPVDCGPDARSPPVRTGYGPLATPARRHHASPPGSGNLRAPPGYEPRRRRLGDPCTGDACRPDRERLSVSPRSRPLPRCHPWSPTSDGPRFSWGQP